MSNLVMSCQNSTVKNDFAKSIINHQSGGPGIGRRICSRSSRVQILGHACKYPTGCLLPVGVFNPVMLCCMFELFVSKYLRGVSVNQLDELRALSTINKPLIITFLQRLQCSTSDKRALILTRFRDIVPTIKFKKKEIRDQFCDSELHEVGVDKKQSALWVAPFFRNGFLLIITR